MKKASPLVIIWFASLLIGVGFIGCGMDTDGDGQPDATDLCPTDPNKTQPGLCGCNVPEQTCSANDPIISASEENAENGEGKEMAFDGDVNTKWLSFSGSAWIQLEFGGGLAKIIRAYSLTSANDHPERDPRDWRLLGSNNGSDWTTLDQRPNDCFSSRFQKKTYRINNNQAYTSYRLDIAANHSPSQANSTQLAEIAFLEQAQDGLEPGAEGGCPNQTGPFNLLFIMTDQQRFDALRHAQNEMAAYTDKLKIRTPQLDRLAAQGAYFRNAYSACPVCAPARSVLRTGCTIERTGVQSNGLANKNVYSLMSQFTDKIHALQSYEQLLVEEQGYVAETYGKWHLPQTLYNRRDSSAAVITYNDYNYSNSSETFSPQDSWGTIYKRGLAYYQGLGEINKTFLDGQQENTFSKYPYTPTALDTRYRKSTNTPLTTSAGFESWEVSQPNVIGRNSLADGYTSSHFNGDMAVRALDRLARQDKPFSLTVSFHNPHAPMVAAPQYFDYYFNNRSNLFVSPSINDSMDNSAYKNSNGRTKLLEAGYGYDDPAQVQQWTASYYALVEEVDTWVGKLLDKLEEHGIGYKTLVIFTSDHGEMLGAHAMREKNIFLEESVHIPLLIAFPGKIAEGLTITEPVGHVDIFATILDYLGASQLDHSDGVSLRRFIEGTSYNKSYDERAVVSEWDYREPQDANSLSRSLGGEVNFMIRKGDYKLMITKKADSNLTDMMYNLANDPYEVVNLIGKNGQSASNQVIGKAEHLKTLLMEWMLRNDGQAHYYSDNKYNNGEGSGDIEEIKKRRKWRSLNYWQSDSRLDFGKAVWNGSAFIRNEYLYIGRTNPGKLSVSSISVKGADASYFSLDTDKASITQNNYVRVKVSFRSAEPVSIQDLDAHIEIINDVHGINLVQFGGALF